LQAQLRNILKHAKATTIEVKVAIVNKALEMSIKDDGVGFDPETRPSGIGFANMARRVELLSGNFQIHSSIGNGCEIWVEMPVINMN
jgi:signal transduction histidine kinase